jgi:two-component system, NarL family, nitrate/nitrite response regulator NarL
MRSIRVVIADRQPVVLQGLAKIFEVQSDFDAVAYCSDGVSCIDAIRKLRPHIAILGTSMPGLTALEILAIVKSESLSTRLVFFTGSLEQHEFLRSAPDAALSVILKDVTPEILLESLRQIARGHKLPPASIEQVQALERSNSALREKVLSLLTERERQIMRLVSEGLSNKAIGRRLNIADGTIKVHLHNIFQKLEINNRTLLATLAISQNENRGAPVGE